MRIVRQEIYDFDGLVEVRELQIDEPTLEEQIEIKETELLKMYNDLLELKNNLI